MKSKALVAVAALGLLGAVLNACWGQCGVVESCPCVDGTEQTAGCGLPATCQDACSAHGGACTAPGVYTAKQLRSDGGVDAGFVTCYCNGSCGCVTSPDGGGATCP